MPEPLTPEPITEPKSDFNFERTWDVAYKAGEDNLRTAIRIEIARNPNITIIEILEILNN